MRKIAILPSMLTTGNLVCGFASVSFAATGLWMYKLAGENVGQWTTFDALDRFRAAGWFIMLAMVFDALDGKIARLTNSTSDFGAELDSLADLTTFGFAPAFLVKAMMSDGFPPRIGWVMSSLFLVCAALRLARFNVDTDEDESAHQYFQGLPTPAAAGMIAVLAILHCKLVQEYGLDLRPLIPAALPLVALALAALMISKLRYLHVASWLFRDHHPAHVFSLILFVVVFLTLTKPYSFALLFGGYCASGPLAALGLRQSVFQKLLSAAGDEEED